MRSLVHLTPADARRIPWRNGRGTTEELAIGPAGATFERGDFDWRVSKAGVDAPGPFSAFPGYDRVLVVTQGDSLLLDHGGCADAARVGLLRPYRFSGDWPTTADLPAGAVSDFNVLARRDRVRADVRVLRPGRGSERAALVQGDAVVHVLQGEIVARIAGEDGATALAPGDTLWVRSVADGSVLDLLGDPRRGGPGVVLLVRIAPVNVPARAFPGPETPGER